MKKLTFGLLLTLTFLSSLVKGQSSLGLDSALYTIPASTFAGNNDTFIVVVKNYGPQPYTGIVHVNVSVDTVGNGTVPTDTVTTLNQINAVLPVGGSIADTIPVTIINFRQGINTVVIWPVNDPGATNLFLVHDSLKVQVLVTGYAGINDLPASRKLLLFPNPAQQQFYVVNTDKNFSIERVRIMTTFGALVRNEKYTGRIDISDLPPGAYLIEFVDSTGKTVRYKAIKE